MRFCLLLSCCLVLSSLAGCGGNSDAANSTESVTASAQGSPQETKDTGPPTKVEGTPSPPPLHAPSGPPPTNVVIRDVKVGTGVEIQPGKHFTTNYKSISYEYGYVAEESWTGDSFDWCWRTGGLTKGWEIGLEGMRVGGQRELIVPSKMAYGSGALVYIIELLSVE